MTGLRCEKKGWNSQAKKMTAKTEDGFLMLPLVF